MSPAKHEKTLFEQRPRMTSTAARARHKIDAVTGEAEDSAIEAPIYAPPTEKADTIETAQAETDTAISADDAGADAKSFFGPGEWIPPVIEEAIEGLIEEIPDEATADEGAPEDLGTLDVLSFDEADVAGNSLGEVDHGPELEIITPTKEPLFLWRGKPIGGPRTDTGPIPVQAPPVAAPSAFAQVTAPDADAPASPVFVITPTKPTPGKKTKPVVGIDEQTWFGDVMQQAINLNASDVHLNINGARDLLKVRIRVDGQMRAFADLEGEKAQRVMGIFKASANFASEGSFVPEEAIYSLRVDGEERKARAVMFRAEDAGDALVMRLPPSGPIRDLDQLDMSDKNLELARKLLLSANRMLLIAGPMGSGKTTTSHAAIMHVATGDRAVWTVEDPVERRLPGLTQLEVDDENGAGFGALLPSLVRADYDTLFLGEIRDKATAAAGVRQAKAGRQVISTIHSNDNVTAVLRLIELAEDTPLSVMDAVKGVVSQRLVRRLNPDWDGEDTNTRYKGRVPIHEVLTMNDDLVEAVMEQKPLKEIKAVAAAASASTFAEDAERLIDAGTTDEAEIKRILGE